MVEIVEGSNAPIPDYFINIKQPSIMLWHSCLQTKNIPNQLLHSRHGEEERQMKQRMGVGIRNPSEV